MTTYLHDFGLELACRPVSTGHCGPHSSQHFVLPVLARFRNSSMRVTHLCCVAVRAESRYVEVDFQERFRYGKSKYDKVER